jgi:hypothetical protein
VAVYVMIVCAHLTREESDDARGGVASLEREPAAGPEMRQDERERGALVVLAQEALIVRFASSRWVQDYSVTGSNVVHS